MIQHTSNPLIEAIKENNFTLVEALTTGDCSFKKSTFDSDFNFQLVFNNKFGIQINPAIFDLLDNRGYFSVYNKLIYFSKNNKFEALSDLLKNANLNRGLYARCAIEHGVRLAVQNSGCKVVEHLLHTIDVGPYERGKALLKLAERKNTEMLENEGPRIANLLLPSSLLGVDGKAHLMLSYFKALKAALLTGKLWLLEMLMNFPGLRLLGKFKERTQQTPLAYLLSQTTKDESILLFLIEHALDKDRFEVRFDEQKNESIFFEKTDVDRVEHVWGPDELKALFKVAIHFPKQTDALLTRFPTIFKPIVETMLKEDGAFISFHTRNIGNCEYRTLLGEILEAHGILKPLNNTSSYRKNKRDRDDNGSDEKNKKHKKT